MAISYNKLWKILIDKKMSRADLVSAFGWPSTRRVHRGRDPRRWEVCRCPPDHNQNFVPEFLLPDGTPLTAETMDDLDAWSFP